MKKETVKKLLSIGLIGMMTVSLAACGSSGGSEEETDCKCQPLFYIVR